MSKTLEQIEAERLSRRQALGRIGFLAGASAIAALTSDELLRKVGAEMQKRAGDNQIANQVAKELQAAGVANATGTVACANCVTVKTECLEDCTTKYSNCLAAGLHDCRAKLTGCEGGCRNSAEKCCKYNHCNCGLPIEDP